MGELRPQLIMETPVRLRIQGLPEDELQRQLTYIDKSVDFELGQLKKNHRLKRGSPEKWKARVEELTAERKKCLLFEDRHGFWTYSGLGSWLGSKFGVQIQNQVQYPEPKRVPWERVPTKISRPYQIDMEESLLKVNHGAVEVGTGLGKSFVIMQIAKKLGLKTVVMTPSVNIAEQIHAEFLKHFGLRYTGQFFDGKKESRKLFTVAVDDSLTKIEPGSDHWKNLSQAQVFIADESHLCPAKTLARVCFGLLAAAPYRFFFSGTQMRNDGLDLLLKAITGNIVYTMTVEQGVDQGWLARPLFRMITIKGSCNFQHPDANEMTRAHLYYEPTVCSKAAEIANLMVESGRKVVILVKELEQFSWVRNWLRHEAKFAHGGVTKTVYAEGQEDIPVEERKIKKEGNDRLVPKEFWDSDPSELVEAFDAGEFPILVGTSCITTGTDIQNVGAIIYLQGGKSEIQVRQAVGRGTRKPPGKTDCYFIDFDVINADVTHRHALERAEIYKGIYPDFEEFPL